MAEKASQLSTLETDIRVLGWACLFTCTLLSGCAEMPSNIQAPPHSFVPSGANHSPVEIGVLIAGWHTGLVLPSDELGPLNPLLHGGPQPKYLSFGWGNRRFYVNAHPSSGDALAALFHSPSALFVQSISTPSEASTGDARIQWICVDCEQLWRLDGYIDRSLSQPNGKPLELGQGPLPGSRFYASADHYSAVHTCNTWTLAALQYARLPVHAGGAIFASQASARIQVLRTCPAP